ELYQSDESHPSLAGSYAAACCFYSSIFRTDPTQIKSDYGLNALEAVVIRNAVKTVFYDQMNSWNIGINSPYADFNTLYVDSSMYYRRKVRFTALSDSSTYKWDMGDGVNKYTRTVEHVYSFPGQYAEFTVTLIVYGCPNDTVSKVISVYKPFTGMSDLTKDAHNIALIPNPAQQQINLISETYNFYRNKIIVRDILGRQVMEEIIYAHTSEINLELNLVSGTYFIELFDPALELVYKGKFVIAF
ncbi:MAG: T9SS type A sorting domain-containing protein, partial [Bacteroidota bacterium]|nr:T9SS type A sorting domain-containing protein [Bacteroidota bacterium]